MEVIRKFINASSLMSIMNLPEAFKGRRLEVIVLPADEQISVEQRADVQDIVLSLIGALPHTDLSLEELRGERLGKYEIAD